MSAPEPQMVDPKDLQPGPIRHETLPPELLEHIRAVYDGRKLLECCDGLWES